VQERQDLEGLVHRSKTTGKDREGVGGRVMATLRVKKYCIATSIVSASM